MTDWDELYRQRDVYAASKGWVAVQTRALSADEFRKMWEWVVSNLTTRRAYTILGFSDQAEGGCMTTEVNEEYLNSGSDGPCTKVFYPMPLLVFIETETDAVHFKLRWG